MPDRPKIFITLGISIAAMAMSTFNTIRTTQLNVEINTLKEKQTSSWMWCTTIKSMYTTWRRNSSKQISHWPTF
jgi:hypothetical protein